MTIEIEYFCYIHMIPVLPPNVTLYTPLTSLQPAKTQKIIAHAIFCVQLEFYQMNLKMYYQQKRTRTYTYRGSVDNDGCKFYIFYPCLLFPYLCTSYFVTFWLPTKSVGFSRPHSPSLFREIFNSFIFYDIRSIL